MTLLSSTKLKHYIVLLVISALSGIGCSLKAQTVKPDSVRFAIGRQINLLLEVPFNGTDIIEWPKISDTITKSIEVISKSRVDTITDQTSNNQYLQQVIAITSFDTGFIVLPPFTFALSGTDGSTKSLSTEPMLFEVYKLKIDNQADIKDIKPILEAPVTFAEILPWLIGLLLLGGVIYGIIYYLKKRKLKPVEKPVPVVKTPAWEIAHAKLNKLKEEQIWQKGDVKEYHTRLTDIIREYFELRYRVNAAEMTSSEIMDAMKPIISDTEAIKSLHVILTISDMAKFAKAHPGAYENEQSMANAFDLIRITTPQPKVIETVKES